MAVVQPAPTPGVAAGQWLFRAELSGEEGSASLRLLLRRLDDERFTLTASDAAGQARWEIRRDRDAALWVDPQGKRFCRLDPGGPLRARLSVPSIRIADLPGLLTGEWPPAGLAVEGAAAVADAVRPFTGERSPPADAERGVWATWTLWEAGGPTAWFKRLGDDSLLSVRRPAVQLRWRLSARGSLGPAATAAGESRGSSLANWLKELPAEAREMVCPGNEIP